MSEQLPIPDLKALRETKLYPVPTKAKRVLRIVRTEHAVYALDLRGRVYSSRCRDRWGRSVAYYAESWQADEIVHALRKLGLLSEKVGAELQAERARRKRRGEAEWQLQRAKDLAELGVPFTKAQLRKLRALAKEQGT